MTKSLKAPAENADTLEAEVRAQQRTVEEWCRQKGTADYAFAAARVMNGWVASQLLTEEQFDAGIRNQPIAR